MARQGLGVRLWGNMVFILTNWRGWGRGSNIYSRSRTTRCQVRTANVALEIFKSQLSNLLDPIWEVRESLKLWKVLKNSKNSRKFQKLRKILRHFRFSWSSHNSQEVLLTLPSRQVWNLSTWFWTKLCWFLLALIKFIISVQRWILSHSDDLPSGKVQGPKKQEKKLFYFF